MKSSKQFKKRLLVFFSIFFIFILTSCNRVSTVTETEFHFGTLIKIVAYTQDENATKTHIQQAFDIMKSIDESVNTYSKTGDLYKVNHHINQWVTVSPTTIELLKYAKKGYDLTEGAYDITVYPLLKLWGFNNLTKDKRVTVPSDADFKKVLSEVNYHYIQIKGNQVKLCSPAKGVDVGSFLKGYAIYKANAYLKSVGENSAMITAVSSIATTGMKPNNVPWEIGLQNPRDPSQFLGVFYLKGDMALGVSGNFQDYLVINHKNYSHILNAKTGWPVNDIDLIALVSNSAYETDLYSTALFELTPQKAIDIINKTPGMEGLVIGFDGKAYYSNKISQYYKPK